MGSRKFSNPPKFSVIGGVGFGLYFTLGIAYFETYPAGAVLPYMLSGVCMMLIWVFISASHFTRDHTRPLLDGLLAGLLGLVVSGVTLWLIGGLMTEAGLSWALLYRVFFNLLLVGILPVVAALISVSPGPKSAEEHPEAAPESAERRVEIESRPSEFVFDAGSGDSVLRVAADSLILIEAADNYCKIHFLLTGIRNSKLVRMPMKEAEQVVQQAKGFHRCHRSYIVNGAMVEKVLGASQSYRLKLRHFPEEVPVSRSFDIIAFRDATP